jgi:opacity protein-like surface antigen
MKVFSVLFGAALAMSPLFAQEESAPSKNEIAVQGFGSFTRSTFSNGVQQSAGDTGGVLASYRYFFNTHSGVELNYGFVSNTQTYGNIAGFNNHSNEITADYVLRLPRGRWTPFVLAGTGAIVFDPANVPGAGTQARAAFVYGAGADFNLTKRVFMRAEYRGLVYNSPTFGFSALSGLDRVTHTAEPSLGFGYRF